MFFTVPFPPFHEQGAQKWGVFALGLSSVGAGQFKTNRVSGEALVRGLNYIYIQDGYN